MTGGCFLAGTLVAMGDGSFVPIEEVAAGDAVRCEVPAAMPGLAGEELERLVSDAGGRVYEGAIITVVVARDGVEAKVSGTPEHPFWCVNRHQWVPIGQLKIGDRLDGLEGDVEVVRREVAFGRVAVFNFTVEQAHSYRVSRLGVLVHNKCSKTIRREWEKANPGETWPKTDDGKNYHVHHKKAKADGGTDDLDNIEPMHPDAHRAHHMANGDFKRWGALGGRK